MPAHWQADQQVAVLLHEAADTLAFVAYDQRDGPLQVRLVEAGPG